VLYLFSRELKRWDKINVLFLTKQISSLLLLFGTGLFGVANLLVIARNDI
jgi:hypothetical protein